MSDAPQTRTDALTPPPNGRSSEVEALTAALAEARWQQTLLTGIVAQMPVGVFVADAKTGLPQLVNQAGIDLLGRGLDPHRRKDESADVYPNYLPGTQQLVPVQELPMVRTMSTGEPVRAEIDVQRPGGRLRVEMATTPVRDAAGRVVSVVAVIQPVTHRPADAVSPELEEERRFQASLSAAQNEASIEGVLIVTADGRKILNFNQRFAQLWKLPPEVVETRVDAEVLRQVADQVAQFDEFLARVQYLYQHPEESSRDEIYLKDGRVFDRHTGPIKDGEEIYGRVWFFRDITDRKRAEQILREREEDLTALLEFSPEAIGVVNTQTGLFESVNQAAERLYGLPRAELEKVGPAQMSPEFQPDGRPSLEAAMEKIGAALQGGHPVFDWTHINAAGTPIPCEVRLVGLAAPRQHLVRFSVTDITTRKQAEAALRTHQAQLSQALQVSKLAYWEYNLEQDQFLFNDQFYALFHTTAEQEGGYVLSSARYAERFLHPDDVALVGAEIEQAIRSTERYFTRELTHRVRYADGGVGHISVRINVERDENGHILRWYGANQDVTASKQTEETLRANQAQLSQALQIAKLAYWEYKPEQDQFLFNDQFYALFHTTAEREGGYALSSARYAERFVYPEDLPIVGAEIELAMKSTDRHYSRQLDHRIQYADGGVGYMSVSINIERDEQGRILRYYGANQDITASKQAEAISAKRAAELEVVAQVGTAAATILDPGQLLQTVVDLTKSNFKLYHAHVYTLNEIGDTLELAAGAGEVGHRMVSQGWRISSHHEHSLVARAARTRQGVIANDVREAPDFLPNPMLPDTRSEMALPIIASDRLLGVLDVQAAAANHFTNEDLRIQSILATQIAVALQNARQFAEARRLADRETLVNAISQQIQNATTVESALQIAARELGRALGAQRTIVQLGQSDKTSH